MKKPVAPLATLLALLAAPALAQTRSQVYGDSLTQQTQTVFVDADAGMTTYESKAAGSTATKAASQLSIGGWAGETRLVGASITAADADVPFPLNGADMKTSFRDVKLMARLGWLIPSIGVSLSQIDVDVGGQHTVGLYGTGLNAGLGLSAPVSHVMIVSGQAMVVQSDQIYDKLNGGATLGPRFDADVNAAYHLVERYVDLMVGYRIRQYSIRTSLAADDERSEGAYAGLRLGIYF